MLMRRVLCSQLQRVFALSLGQRVIHMEFGGDEDPKPRSQTESKPSGPQTKVEEALRPTGEPQPDSEVALADGQPYTKRDALIDGAEEKRLAAIADENAKIPFPEGPESQVPQKYLRVKRHAKLYKFDEERGLVLRKEYTVPLPPPENHPWVENCPIGPYIVHGDGQQQIVGHGEVGWDESPHWREYPRQWRGFHHFTTIGLGLPSNHGEVHKDVIVKHSLQLTGRGLFAQKDIKAGDRIMVVASQSVNLGFNAEVERLCQMVRDILLRAYHGTEEDRTFLHQWILSCQLSSLVELWPSDGTKKIIDMIGGKEVLDELELHEHHIARMASILDLNSFLVESYFAEKKGMVFFAEASVLNHSCCPNADYDIIPASSFADSPFCEKREDPATAPAADMTPEEAAANPPEVDPTQPVEAAEGAPKEVVAADDNCEGIEPPSKYLFCCKANRDIKAGEEILISYVPPGWRFEDRQFVLHDRYRFWCKCPKCSVALDIQFKRLPKLIIAIVIVFSLLQLVVYQVREDAVDRWDRATKAQETGNYNIDA